MERKQKRGWLKFALTTAMAFAFMGVMAVTAMAGTHATVTLVRTDVPEAHEDVADLAMLMHVEIASGQNLGNLFVELNWQTNLLTMETAQLQYPLPIFTAVHSASPHWTITGQPLMDGRNVLPGPRIGVESAMIGLNPSQPVAVSADAALLLFSLPSGVYAGDVTFTMEVYAAAEIQGGTPLPLPAAAVSVVNPSALSVPRIGWRYFGVGTPAGDFIDAVMGPHQAWFAFLQNDVWLGVLEGHGSIYQAHTTWQAWIDATPDAE